MMTDYNDNNKLWTSNIDLASCIVGITSHPQPVCRDIATGLGQFVCRHNDITQQIIVEYAAGTFRYLLTARRRLFKAVRDFQ